jgi:hypothetical protein
MTPYSEVHMILSQKSEVYIAPFSNQECTWPHLINGSVDGIIHRPPVHFPSLTNTMCIILYHSSTGSANLIVHPPKVIVININSSNGSAYSNIHQLKVSIVLISSRRAYLTVYKPEVHIPSFINKKCIRI